MSSLIFPWCFQEVLPASDSNRHLKDIDEEIFDDDDFYHQVGDGKCVLELLFQYFQRKCSWFCAPYFFLPVKLAVLTPRGDSALSFYSRALWVWSCPVDVNLLLVLSVRAAGAVPAVLPGKRLWILCRWLFSVGRDPLGKNNPRRSSAALKVALVSAWIISFTCWMGELSWAALALLLELGQLGSRPAVPFICKILRSRESAGSAGKTLCL